MVVFENVQGKSGAAVVFVDCLYLFICVVLVCFHCGFLLVCFDYLGGVVYFVFRYDCRCLIAVFFVRPSDFAVSSEFSLL